MDTKQLMEWSDKHLMAFAKRYPVALVRGEGARVWDSDGKEYLDFTGGIAVTALGHCHPKVVGTMREQAATLLHVSNLFHIPQQIHLAKLLCDHSFADRVFFSNSGAEANETALKMAKAHGHAVSPEKFEIVSLDNSFHGRTVGALSVTGQESYRRDFEPLMPGVHFVPRNDCTALEQVVCDRTAGIILELVQGEGGIYPMTEAYIRKARELADRFNAILIFDEIQCGVGRTGTYFAYQLMDPPVMPDVMTAAKPVACGLPLGIVAANERAAKGLGKGKHGTTFGGGPLVCRVGLEFFDILDELLPRISSVGSYFRMRLTELSRSFSFIKEVRGVGLMIGVELEFPCKQIVLDCIEHGVLLNCTHDYTLRMLPPYIITEQEVDRVITVLKRVFKNAKPPA